MNDRQFWLNLADELNDRDIRSTVDDFEDEMVEAAERWAEKFNWPFPPSTGDFDRWYAGDFYEICPRCQNMTGGFKCRHCGVDLSDLA